MNTQTDNAKEALDALRAEGHDIATDGEGAQVEEHEIDPAPKDPVPKQPETPATPPEVKKPEADKPKDEETPPAPKKETEGRAPKMIPAYQHMQDKATWDKEKSALEAKIAEFSKNPQGINPAQQEEIDADIKALAEEAGVPEDFLKKFTATILSKVKPPTELVQQLQDIQAEKANLEQATKYSVEFDSEVLPLVKAKYPEITEEALTEIKAKMKDLAFSKSYIQVPLTKIFKAEIDDLGVKITTKRKSAEPAGSRPSRGDATVDFDNLSEDDFKNLTPEKQIEFSNYMSSKGSGGWARR